MNRLRAVVPSFALAWALFALATLSPRIVAGFGSGPALLEQPWFTHFVGKSTLAILALAAMAAAGGPWRDWGFRAPANPRWRFSALRGCLLGAAATILLIVSPAQGMTWIRDLGLPGIVLWIWLHSSFTEELFVRGWFQHFVRPASRRPLEFGSWSLSPEVVLSGVLFGSMHLTVLSWGADWWTVAIIVPATTLLGLCAAEDRARSGSLAPAVLSHVAFNLGGFLAGVAAAIAYVVATGQKPSF